MNCAEFEILLCDYIDGTLDPVRRRELEAHREGCAACTALAEDVRGAVAFMDRVADPEPPPELLTRITFEIPTGGQYRRKGIRGWFTGWLQPLLQPRFAMGMAMTILSFSMLARLAGIEPRQLRASDLHPGAVWTALDNRVHRVWERGVKYYENLRLVYEVQTRLQEWTRQEEEDRRPRTLEENPAAAPKAEGQQP